MYVSSDIFKKRDKQIKNANNHKKCLEQKRKQPTCTLIPELCSPLPLAWQRWHWADGLCWNWKSVEMHF